MNEEERHISSIGYNLVLDSQQHVIKGIFCQHGPTLLFEKLDQKRAVVSKFYACSACRDRKQCSVYVDISKKLTQASIEARQDIYDQHAALDKQTKYVSFSEKLELKACTRCGIVNTTSMSCQDHHPELQPLTADMYEKPSHWIPALKTNETNAQFFFKEDVLRLVGGFFLSSDTFSHILCIGTPTLHEYITRHQPQGGVTSFLLDIDVRMRQFHEKFCHYNMFNNHFFLESEEKKLKEELENATNVLLVIDPPYGGLLEGIRSSITSLHDTFTRVKDIKTMLFFPYFMEPHMTKSLPYLHMTDYKVDYANHRGYDGTRKSRGSPARIFTDIPENDFVLPSTQGYKYCDACQRYVHKNNKHCDLCSTCTTKDGSTYKHCDKCTRCVKPSWRHCDECNKCALQDHACSEKYKDGCRHCGELDHKVRQCPTRAHMHPVQRSKRPTKRARRLQQLHEVREECKRNYTGPKIKGNPLWKDLHK